MHEVIICEKPSSAEKIAKALDPKAKAFKYNKKVKYWKLKRDEKDISIFSAVGHLYSLAKDNPKDEFFFDLHWAPLYEIDKKNKAYTKNYVKAIEKHARGADKYIHACDYDIEGTLIGYLTLKYGCGEDSLKKASRMKFSTLTKKDIVEAYENRIDIDKHQVDGGIARHVLDYYFGVNISKALTQSVRAAKSRYLGLSAGRVQTPALSILVEREKEIKEFVPEPYWLIKAKLADYDIVADHVDGKIFDKARAEEILSKCNGKDGVVDSIRISHSTTKPPVPFNLGGLQAEAYNVFGFSPKKTQVIAQKLYSDGYTSYPRTSSQKLPESLDFKNIFMQLKKNKEFGKHIAKLPSKLKPHEGKKDDAAHPAIHPTGILPKSLDKDEKKIYDLIVYRFIALFFEAAKFESMSTHINISEELFGFRRRRVTHKGWMEHYPFRKIDNEEFPEINEGDVMAVEEIISEEKETKPPARYNEASLIKELEKRELGTKATRADIITKLYDRKYISGNKIEVNQLGENIFDTLNEYCSNLTSEELTREFENKLESINDDEATKDEIIKEGRQEVTNILMDIEKNEKEIGSHIYDAYQESNIICPCPNCDGNLVKRYSPKTKQSFVGCSNYPDCKTTFSLPKGARFLKQTCDKCGLPMISFGSKPPVHACLDPNCGKEKTKPAQQEIVGKCPQCGGDLIKRSGRFGEFIGCKSFPKCRFTCGVDELDAILKASK
ncbi:MAG: DNA topoisomerase I [Methanobrevibacter sp.]|uniref:DNA topoisomerase I n=1 Tax=Methanobrevibacter sp. TaxID=66852 RepID=UPI0026DFDCE5|nr:DNA topoisomerase I [Methanobrevibacter sp.]MDO5848540.1 DNA topoisomerase I [Methanobrevibacter sp.]